MKHYQKYPKNSFDLLFLRIQSSIAEHNGEQNDINYQKFSQCHKIFYHKLGVMGIKPPFDDKEWFQDHFDDLVFWKYNMEAKEVLGNKTLIFLMNKEEICSVNVSSDFFRVVKNYKEMLFIEADGFIFDFLPLPDEEDIKDYDKYNFEKNLISEQMRYLRILFSQIEQDVETDWEQYEEGTDMLVHNAYVYQNRRYDEACDNSIPLLEDDDVANFFENKEKSINESFTIILYPTLRNRLGKRMMVLKSKIIDNLMYKCPLTPEFYRILEDAIAIAFCVKDFEIIDMIPIYDTEEDMTDEEE